MAAQPGSIKVKLELDTDDAVRSLKQVEFSARKAARAVAHLQETITGTNWPDAIALLETAGLKVVFQHDKDIAEEA